MSSQNAITRLMAGLRREYHDFEPSLQTFPDVNPDKIAAEFGLETEGEARGGRNEPSADSLSLDDVELRIVERIERLKNSAHETLSEELRVYDRRLSALGFEERFNTIRNAAPAAVGDFIAEAKQGRGHLFSARRHMKEAEDERDDFGAKHRIKRVSRQTEGGLLTFKIGLLLALIVVEIGMNGVFLSRGSDMGLIGGIVEATVFALLNVMVSFGMAWAGVRWINHRNVFAKIVGLTTVIVYLAFAFGLNLALAHFREASGALIDDVGREVMSRLKSSPLVIDDIKSWLFFSMGAAFSAIAFIDALLIFDPYPGFGPLQTRVARAHDVYNELYADLIDRLMQIRDQAIDVMDEAARDLALRRGEYDTILQSRARLGPLFVGHQDALETAANRLLQIYRAANARARTNSEAPARFNTPYQLVRIPIAVDTDETTARDELRKAITEANAVLTSQSRAIHTAFESAMESYKEVDELLPETRNATVNFSLAH